MVELWIQSQNYTSLSIQWTGMVMPMVHFFLSKELEVSMISVSVIGDVTVCSISILGV